MVGYRWSRKKQQASSGEYADDLQLYHTHKHVPVDTHTHTHTHTHTLVRFNDHFTGEPGLSDYTVIFVSLYIFLAVEFVEK